MNNNHPIPMKGGAEYDAFTNYRRFSDWKAGERARAKAQYWKRVRSHWLMQIRKEIDDHLNRDKS